MRITKEYDSVPRDPDIDTAHYVEYECGCWEEYGYSAAGTLELHKATVCESCSSQSLSFVTRLVLDSKAQLTLELPSTKGDRSDTTY